MKLYNITFANGDLYTEAGLDESDAVSVLLIFYPALAGGEILSVEVNEAYANEGVN